MTQTKTKEKIQCRHCEDEARCRGLCWACYHWEYYHMARRHGSAYFAKYTARTERLLRRAKAYQTKFGSRRSLRVVKGGK